MVFSGKRPSETKARPSAVEAQAAAFVYNNLMKLTLSKPLLANGAQP
jgi:hypothetical protein